MESYKKMIQRLSHVVTIFCTAVLFVMVITMLLEIILRNFFRISLPWVQELNIILVSWLVFFGASAVYNTIGLINVDFLYNKSRGIGRLIWDWATQLIIAAVLIFFIVFGTKYCIQQLSAKTNAMGLPFSVYSLPLILTSIMILAGLIGKLYESTNRRKEWS